MKNAPRPLPNGGAEPRMVALGFLALAGINLENTKNYTKTEIYV